MLPLTALIAVVPFLVFLVDGVKHKVNDSKRSQDVKKSFGIKGQSTMMEKVEEAKQLKAYNDYDPSFSSMMWITAQLWRENICEGDYFAQNSEFDSYCWVVSPSDANPYWSYRTLYTSDCSEKTIGFYTNNECSGTPNRQGNTVSTGYEANNPCVMQSSNNENDILAYEAVKFYCQPSALEWSGGGGAVQITDYYQTESCAAGKLEAVTYVRPGCYMKPFVYTQSFEFAPGPRVSLYQGSGECGGTADDDDHGDDDIYGGGNGDDDGGGGSYRVDINVTGCQVKDGGVVGPDDDYMIDDLQNIDNMAPYVNVNTNQSIVYKWIDPEPSAIPTAAPTQFTCDRGEYRSTVYSTSTGATVFSCKNCPAGRYNADVGHTNTRCSICPTGSYSTEGEAGCSQCPGGHYCCPGASVYIMCPDGTYAAPESALCTSCPAGLYSKAGAEECSGCPSNANDNDDRG